MAFIEVRDVTKTYKMGEVEIKAVDEIGFGIDKGEFVVIVGPSGAGKTTILNILGGMDTATSGTIYVDNVDITKFNENELPNTAATTSALYFSSITLSVTSQRLKT